MQIMPELPNWIQNVRDHAEEAQGPWWVAIARDESGRSMYEVTTAPWKHAPNVFPLSQASMEKLVSHPDVLRLVELVGEMAGALEAASEHLSLGQYVQSPGKCRVCGGYVHTKCLTICEQCAARMVREALDKYRGEEENA